MSISCSNSDKTGSSKGLGYYAGTWELAPTTVNATITISNDGTVTFNNDKSTNVTDKGNETYEVKFTPANEGESILTLTFTSDTAGIFILSGSTAGSGTLKKQ
ncbi:hypothetical protein [Brachyspira sp. SAP_772]|uniref:hypothetical protein n=1 Tax=Brachyspira sp. SAP_772 TaxID=2608385 RepID=UPI001E60EB1A|nr:hypothetical protein [Brachyspira sp. SAP_772]